ncbi:MAG: DUF1736 domain-containing protein [Deltaproteobacteria bacterium]|nr:DUF1736 domain-containing protein [Deltaproteobacteria bacterium]
MRYIRRITGELNLRVDRLGREVPGGAIPCAVIPVVAALVAYAGTFDHEFAFDDVRLIPDNPLICGGRDVTDVWRSNYWEGSDVGGERGAHWVGSAYRPVTILSHALICRLAGPGAFWPHAVNLALHVLNALLLFALLTRLMAAGGKSSSRAAAVAATLFAIHPLNSEVVFLAVGRSDLLATAAVLGVALLAASPVVHRRPVVTMAGVFLLTGLGMLSKENVVAAPVLGALAYWCGHPAASRKWVRFMVVAVLPAVLAIVLYVGVRSLVLGAAYDATKYSLLDNPLATADYSVRLATGLGVLAVYLWRFVAPNDLSADYSFAQVPPIQEMADPQLAVGVVVLLFLVGAGVASIRRVPLATLGIGWFLFTWVPVSNIPFPIGTIMAERLCYLPCIGLVVALVALWRHWRTRAVVKGGDAAVALFLVAVLTVVTVIRGKDYADNCTLFQASAMSSPNSAKAHFGHGVCLLDDLERQGEAIAAFDKALKLYPDYEAATIQLAQLLERTGHPGDGIVYLKSFLASHPKAFNTALSLAKMLARQGRPDKARRLLQELDRRRPGDTRVKAALSHL